MANTFPTRTCVITVVITTVVIGLASYLFFSVQLSNYDKQMEASLDQVEAGSRDCQNRLNTCQDDLTNCRKVLLESQDETQFDVDLNGEEAAIEEGAE